MSDLDLLFLSFVGFSVIALVIVNVSIWSRVGRSKDLMATKIRSNWLGSLVFLFFPYFAPVLLIAVGHLFFSGAEEIREAPGRTLAVLTLVNSCWAIVIAVLFVIWLM